MGVLDPLLDPFTTPDQAINPQGNDLLPEWNKFLDGGGRAAMVQMGLNLMQPMPILQSTGGHIATGVGAAGEALARREQMDLAERATGAKEDSAQARIMSAENQLTRRGASQDFREREFELRKQRAELEQRKFGATQEYRGLKTKNARERDAQKNLSQYVKEDAANIQKMLDAEDAALFLNPNMQRNPGIQKYRGLTQKQIEDAKLDDPVTREMARKSKGNVVSLEEEQAAEQEGVGVEAAPSYGASAPSVAPGTSMAPVQAPAMAATAPAAGAPQMDHPAIGRAREAIARGLPRDEAIRRLQKMQIPFNPRDL